MARELVVVWVGRHRRDRWERVCRPYRERISRHLPLREVAVKSIGSSSDRERLRNEGEALIKALPAPVWSVALDRRGKMRDSLELAGWLTRKLEEWPHPIAFLLGSDLGLAEAVRRESRERLSLGPLTLPHELARLLLYEQLYRALSISAGIKYHRLPL